MGPDMGFYDQILYKDLERNLKEMVGKKTNFLMVTIPGLGISYFVRKYLERFGHDEIRYIDKQDMSLGEFNILDLNFDKDSQMFQIAEGYLKRADLNQKFGVVVNTPDLMETEDFNRSYTSSHVYTSYYFRARDLKDTVIFIKELDGQVNEEQAKQIFDLGGGIGRLTKFLVFHKTKLEQSVDEWLEDRDLSVVLRPTINSISTADDELLARLEVIRNGRFGSQILARYYELHPRLERMKIITNPDLSFSEDGVLQDRSLTKLERLILEQTLKGQGMITKERISDCKWGEGTYEKYSDQAIGKTIQRLNKKLKVYTFKVVMGVGYKLTKRV